jgi:hypothetical protein
MTTLHALMQDNGLPNRPILLVEPHRGDHGVWRIKFSYDDLEPLSMDAQQASEFAISLYQIGEDEIASEIDEAVGRAKHYGTM